MKTKILALATFALTLFASCQKDDTAIPTNPSGGTSNAKGAMNVKMTDAPGNYAAMNVEITKVEVMSAQTGSWIELNNQTQHVSVLDLNNGVETSLASNTTMDAGMYTKVRLTFGGDNRLTLHAGTNGSSSETTVTMSYPGTKEIVIDINSQVTAGGSSTVVLDFNVAKSVTEFAGQYIIAPVITKIEDAETGVRGRFSSAVHAAIIVEGQGYHYATYANGTANFLVRGVKPGTYKVTVLPTPAQIASGMPSEFSVQNVVVTRGSIKDMGTINM
ncbi:MAG TPA: DUF4382 domain-containing protein [Bacteroidia bacterium]